MRSSWCTNDTLLFHASCVCLLSKLANSFCLILLCVLIKKINTKHKRQAQNNQAKRKKQMNQDRNKKIVESSRERATLLFFSLIILTLFLAVNLILRVYVCLGAWYGSILSFKFDLYQVKHMIGSK